MGVFLFFTHSCHKRFLYFILAKKKKKKVILGKNLVEDIF